MVLDNFSQYSATITKKRIIIATTFFLVLPLVIGIPQTITIIIFAIFASGYNLLFGYGGELSFGHAAFFGLGAYGTVLTYPFAPNIFFAIFGGVMLAAAGGAVIGLISLQRRGIYFAMITLALAHLIYIFFVQATDITGGVSGVGFPIGAGIGPISPRSSGLGLYLVSILTFLFVLVAIRRITQSPFGHILIGVRENPDRLVSLGYDEKQVLYITFVFSSLISGIAGSLYAIRFGFVSPTVLFWLLSGEVILMTLIGGAGTLIGPLIGATVYQLLSQNLTDYFRIWEIPLGIIIILFVIFTPQGIYGMYLKYQGEGEGYGIRDIISRYKEELSRF